MDMQFLALSTYQICVARNQPQNFTFSYVFTSRTKSTDILINQMQPLVFWEGQVCFPGKKLDHLLFLAILVQKVCNAMTFSTIAIIERYSANKNFFHETMIAEIKKAVLKRIESLHQDRSYKDTLIDNFRVSRFRSEEPNAKLDSRIVIQK